MKALYVAVPLALASLSRITRLHDKVSDVLGIRRRFDTRHVLALMAEKTGISLSPTLKQAIEANRRDAMYKVFYPHVSLPQSSVDAQLVRTALDEWGWFWCALEASAVCVVTLVALGIIGAWYHFIVVAISVLVLAVIMLCKWHACKRAARHEVSAILGDDGRASGLASGAGRVASRGVVAMRGLGGVAGTNDDRSPDSVDSTAAGRPLPVFWFR